MRLYEFYANPDATPSNPKYRNDISQQLGPLEIGQQSTRMKNSSKKFIQVLKQDKILNH